jgi:lactate dehydrogenase-like 2-hydroxyacid dehydrogenase
VDVWPGRTPPAPADLRARTRDAEGLLCLLTDRVDAELLDACPRLRAVSVMAVGTDNVDAEAAAERGVAVSNTPGVLDQTTADLAFALMLGAARRVTEAAAAARAGEWVTWEPAGWLGEDVHGAVLGLVGRGRIGSAVAQRAEGFGMQVLSTRSSSGVPLPELLERSDFVSLHCPLTEETRGLIGPAELRRMKPTATLVNTARGEVVDTDALVQALGDRTIAAAGLDVTDPEPLPAGHPLYSLPNALVTPHVGSASRHTRKLMAALAVDNLLAALATPRAP